MQVSRCCSNSIKSNSRSQRPTLKLSTSSTPSVSQMVGWARGELESGEEGRETQPCLSPLNLLVFVEGQDSGGGSPADDGERSQGWQGDGRHGKG